MQQAIPVPTQPTIDAVFEKVNQVLDLNKLLRDALENATQSLLNVSVATQEQISLVVEFTKETPQDVTLSGGVVIPNAMKLMQGLRAEFEQMLETFPKENEALKQELQLKFLAFLEQKEEEAQEQRVQVRAEFDTLMQQLQRQKETQEKEYEGIKQEVQEKLELINTDAFLNEFAELKVSIEAGSQKVIKTMNDYKLFVTNQNALNAAAMQEILELAKALKQRLETAHKGEENV